MQTEAPKFLSIALNQDSPTPDGEREEHHGGRSITDIKTQMVGTNWKADSRLGVRPGLYPTLRFYQNNVQPANYRYEITPHDYTVRIFFNHGDTQVMLLTDNGRRLNFTFNGKDYSYELSN